MVFNNKYKHIYQEEELASILEDLSDLKQYLKLAHLAHELRRYIRRRLSIQS